MHMQPPPKSITNCNWGHLGRGLERMNETTDDQRFLVFKEKRGSYCKPNEWRAVPRQLLSAFRQVGVQSLSKVEATSGISGCKVFNDTGWEPCYAFSSWSLISNVC